MQILKVIIILLISLISSKIAYSSQNMKKAYVMEIPVRLLHRNFQDSDVALLPMINTDRILAQRPLKKLPIRS